VKNCKKNYDKNLKISEEKFWWKNLTKICRKNFKKIAKKITAKISGKISSILTKSNEKIRQKKQIPPKIYAEPPNNAAEGTSCSSDSSSSVDAPSCSSFKEAKDDFCMIFSLRVKFSMMPAPSLS
jgi:hypothetical protein